jgi:hypothetical protein
LNLYFVDYQKYGDLNYYCHWFNVDLKINF